MLILQGCAGAGGPSSAPRSMNLPCPRSDHQVPTVRVTEGLILLVLALASAHHHVWLVRTVHCTAATPFFLPADERRTVLYA